VRERTSRKSRDLTHTHGLRAQETARDGRSEGDFMHHVWTRLLGCAVATAVSVAPLRAQTFSDPLQLIGRYPIDGALADVNGDGLADLVTVSNSPISGQNSVLQWLPNTGAGVFGASTGFAVGNDAIDLEIGDLNGDSRPDAVVVDSAQDLVYVFLGSAGGSFAPNGTHSTHGAPGSGVTPVSITLARIDGDAHLDIVTTNNSKDVSILFGDGAGSFTAATTFSTLSTGASAYASAASDLDGDGDLDLIAPLSAPNNQLSIWLNNGAGSFVFGAYVSTAIDASSPRVADFDLDGHADIAVAMPYANAVHVYRGDGTGTGYSAPVVFAEIGAPNRLELGDFNGDGKTDFASLNLNSSYSVFLGTGSASISTGVFGRYATNPYGVALSVGKLDGDATPDIATVSQGVSGAGAVVAHLGAGAGNFASARSYPTVGAGASAAIGEFNGDGKRDLVISHFNIGASGSPELSLLLQRSGGVFGNAISIPIPATSGCAVVGDIDLDGKDDIVAAATGSFFAPGASVLVLRGVGNGTFLAPVAFPILGAMPRNVALADLNNDGRLDAITANLVTSDISVLLGTTSGWGFQAPTTYNVTTSSFSPYMVAAGDLNSDQLADLVIGHNDSTISHLTVLLNTGGGVFNPAAATAAPVGGFLPIWATIGDVTGDFLPDLVSANSFAPGADLGIAAGNGLGGFSAPTTIATHPQPFAIALADFNADGFSDVVSSHVVQTNHIVVLRGGAGGALSSPELYASGERPQSLAVGDVNADGAPDVITVNYDSGNVTVRLN